MLAPEFEIGSQYDTSQFFLAKVIQAVSVREDIEALSVESLTPYKWDTISQSGYHHFYEVKFVRLIKAGIIKKIRLFSIQFGILRADNATLYQAWVRTKLHMKSGKRNNGWFRTSYTLIEKEVARYDEMNGGYHKESDFP